MTTRKSPALAFKVTPEEYVAWENLCNQFPKFGKGQLLRLAMRYFTLAHGMEWPDMGPIETVVIPIPILGNKEPSKEIDDRLTLRVPPQQKNPRRKSGA